jgi:uncharacterized protein
MKQVAVAFSGGVDSTFLLSVAREVLEDQAVAVTARSETYINTEYEAAREIAVSLGVKQIILKVNELEFPHFGENSPDRCYFCKKELFARIKQAAEPHGITVIADGTHADDMHDYRPGMKALKELGIRSPLKEAGLTKSEIRKLSEERGLKTADKPSMACLASRFPYGTKITQEKLKMVADAEACLHQLGFIQVRVRHHDHLARIEVIPEDIARLVEDTVREKLIGRFREIGYGYIAVDLQGYRTGSMNEMLPEKYK